MNLDRNSDLYHYFLEHSWQLTEEWYKKIDKSNTAGVYASNDPKVIDAVKQQNHDFHVNFSEVFIKEKDIFLKDFEQWILKVARDEEHVRTPIHYIIREFHRTREQYFELIQSFISSRKDQYSFDDMMALYQVVNDTISYVIEWFTEEYNTYSQRKLNNQQELIMKLSTPIINLSKEVALLPLVGEIDSERGKMLLEKTLDQCNRTGVNKLLLDLSGVVSIDTHVAQQLIQLIDALSLIGVKVSLSGIRPEIAQTAGQLGLSFDNASINSSLAQSIRLANL